MASEKVNEMNFFGISEAIFHRERNLQHPKNVAAVEQEAQKEPDKKVREKAKAKAIAILESEKYDYLNTEKDARRIFGQCVRDQYPKVIQ